MDKLHEMLGGEQMDGVELGGLPVGHMLGPQPGMPGEQLRHHGRMIRRKMLNHDES